MDDRRHLKEEIRQLVQRLERISVDSTWARRSSGSRGELLRWLELLEDGEANGEEHVEFTVSERERLHFLIEAGYRLLVSAAKEYQGQ